ncbi:hypothetical protein Pint_08633 [Pistacia integerrima]|uniref:Uncharacterized protein n=1 Tax=Pistacia integerrima TaxID=434235 RepID=A0ACC0XUA8_9ROSI|nr:hypothetical protein Pint_08633 [Pistacia integerrima]
MFNNHRTVDSSEKFDEFLDCEDANEVCLKRRKAKDWKKVKCQLVEYNYLPGYLRDNEYILGYYRAEWPLKQILFSLFSIHNETLNVWTHLIGFFLFLCLTIYTAMSVPGVVDLNALQQLPDMFRGADWPKIQELLSCLPSIPNIPDHHKLKDVFKMSLPSIDFLKSPSACVKDDVMNMVAPRMVHEITRWPFYTFLGGAMFCLLASSCPVWPPLSSLSFQFSRSPNFGTPVLPSSLVWAFQGLHQYFHKLILFQGQAEALQTTGYEILMGMFYGLGALIYATRIPERWKPGKFDIAGHSHQLFHVLVVAGAYTHYRAGLVYLRWRDLEGCNQ